MLGTKIPELMEFPSTIALKVIGEHEKTMRVKAETVMQKHSIHEFSITAKESKTGKYVSLSIEFEVASPEQMESLYKALAAIKEVRMVL